MCAANHVGEEAIGEVGARWRCACTDAEELQFADLLQWGPIFGETHAASWQLAVCLNGWDRAARAFETHPGAASTTASPSSATR